MLNKNPSLRPAAAEILKSSYIDEQLKVCKEKQQLYTCHLSTYFAKPKWRQAKHGWKKNLVAVNGSINLGDFQSYSTNMTEE